jgi:hypothetical protein
VKFTDKQKDLQKDTMGSSVKKVVKKVTKPIKKIVSSPVGQLGLAFFAPQFSFLPGASGGLINKALSRALINAAATKVTGGDVDLKSSHWLLEVLVLLFLISLAFQK